MSKIELFRNIFKGRQDIVPRFWKSKDGQRAGYTPLCHNEWKKDVCQKPCRNCTNADYIPLSDSLILDHFKGTHILGVYPLLEDNTCHFVASDFDNHNGARSPLEDVKTFYEVCQVQGLPSYVLRSKSGNGYHVYIFLSSPVPAWKARIVAFALLQEAGVIGDDIELSSFDRLFPNQDELSGKGFGNLIALPFQGMAGKQDHTLFLDPETRFKERLKDQGEALSDIQRVPESKLDDLIQEWGLDRNALQGQRGNGNPPGWVAEALTGVDEGDRDSMGIKLAGYFHHKKLNTQVISVILNLWNEHNRPPLEHCEIEKIVASIERYKNGVQKNEGKKAKIFFVSGEKSGEEMARLER